MTDRVTAEDLVQETLLHAFKAFDRFEPGSNFKAWVFRILFNSAMNLHRYRRVRVLLTDAGRIAEELPESKPYLSPQVVDDLGSNLGDDVLAALKALPAAYRVIFVLSTFEEFTYRELAAILDIPIGTVMSRLSRARGLLREALAARVPGEAPP
ncbi:MAG: sigma-70 family RNA polymerase sigma factor [Planctomycetes bacterium]|nr:sigma-70 family RNA polymerase sigma factor [Planctomycetota bacterium]